MSKQVKSKCLKVSCVLWTGSRRRMMVNVTKRVHIPAFVIGLDWRERIPRAGTRFGGILSPQWRLIGDITGFLGRFM